MTALLAILAVLAFLALSLAVGCFVGKVIHLGAHDKDELPHN